ncbi:hypothetical protein F4W70_27885, partial [Pseudomonas cannabina]
MQAGYNVYTVQQAARRSWRIGQKQDVSRLCENTLMKAQANAPTCSGRFFCIGSRRKKCPLSPSKPSDG